MQVGMTYSQNRHLPEIIRALTSVVATALVIFYETNGRKRKSALSHPSSSTNNRVNIKR